MDTTLQLMLPIVMAVNEIERMCMYIQKSS